MAREIDLTNATLLELVLTRVGRPLKAARISAFIVAWGVTRRELGREPTPDEHADLWRQPRSSVFREQAEFREAFPGFSTPAPILDHMERQRASEASAIDFAAIAS